jgi:hypothetical protein
VQPRAPPFADGAPDRVYGFATVLYGLFWAIRERGKVGEGERARGEGGRVRERTCKGTCSAVGPALPAP